MTTNLTNSTNKVPNVPPLRFPEFSGEYEKHSLGEMGNGLIGLTYSPKDVVNNNGTIVFRSSNVQNGVIDYSDLVRVDMTIRDNLITRKDDLLICARNGSPRLIGKNTLLKEKDAGQTFGAFMLVYRSQDNPYIHKLLNTKRYMSQVGENLGARINQITSANFSDFEFYFPQTKAERTKVARFLDLIDQRIETQNKIIQHLESLIKGISKMLLTKQGNTFIKDCLVCNSSTLQESSVLPCGKYPVYGATGISGYLDVPQVEHDAILIIKDGAGVGNVRYATDKHGVIGTLNYLSAKNGYNLKYLYYCLRIFNFTPFVTGLAIPHIYFRDYGNAKIYCPSLIEQKHIANNLSNIERKIEVEKQILEKFKEQKKYLLSQMFI